MPSRLTTNRGVVCLGARRDASQPSLFAFGVLTCVFVIGGLMDGGVGRVQAESPESAGWLSLQQDWRRDTPGPIVSLGKKGQFDDTHIFAPLVAYEDGRYQLWYCGSTASVAERVFALGLAGSRDGQNFRRLQQDPVFEFGDNKHSILTPTLLRSADGAVLRQNGQLRMWFSSTWFAGGNGKHMLHESRSRDGRNWRTPSDSQLDHVYAPTILFDKQKYWLWYTDVSRDPWTIRRAVSNDGMRWQVDPQPCLQVDQEWERGRLFYPTVLKSGATFLMWYGSYNSRRANTTAIGFAVSDDGVHWRKHPQNPVLRPDPSRSWESHYATSQSIIRLPDGSFRIWFASRKKPPFVNKYFALNTAIWNPNLQKPPNKESGTDGTRSD